MPLTLTCISECLGLLQAKFLYLMANILKMKNMWFWTTSNLEVQSFAQHQTRTVSACIGSIQS